MRANANASRPAIPSLFLSNVRALDNKMDLLRLCQCEMLSCSAFVLTETWHSNNMPDPIFELDGQLLFCSDGDQQLSGKTRGWGLCIYINKSWCTNCSLVGTHCSEAVEHLTVKRRPQYLLREFTAVYIVAVYVPPQATACGHSVGAA